MSRIEILVDIPCQSRDQIVGGNIIFNKQCRICFQIESQQINDLIAPCNCIGSIKYVHTKCLKNWFKKILAVDTKPVQQFVNGIVNIKCQMCKFQIPCQQTKLWVWRNSQQLFSEQIKCNFLFYILALLILLSLILALINFMVVNKLNFSEKNLVKIVQSTFLVVSIICLTSFFAILLVFFFRKCLLVKKIKLNLVKDYQTIYHRKHHPRPVIIYDLQQQSIN